MSKLADALRQTADCLEDVANGKGGWAWEEVLQEARAALAADGWQPIETAPRTGVTVQVFQPWRSGCDEIMMAHYANGWVWQAACDRCGVRNIKPTHWQPLPSPPKE